MLIAIKGLSKVNHTIARQSNDFLRLCCMDDLFVFIDTSLDYSQIAWKEQMITKHNADGSITFIYESWDELLNQEPTWQPDSDLYAKDKEDERIWGY